MEDFTKQIVGNLKICPYCKKEFYSQRGNKIYCSWECQYRNCSKIRYHKYKNNLDFKIMNRNNFNNWLKTHREHFNELMREPNRIRQARLYKERKERCVCIRCGGVRDVMGKLKCLKCLNLNRKVKKDINNNVIT